MKRTKPPFRADHVGSYLRTPAITEARAKRDCGKISNAELKKIEDQEIIERCIYALVNEGARILEEGIALRASDIDTMYLNGYGFPAWRGGPMWQVDNVIGMKKAAERIKAYEAKYGARWKIAPLIEKLAAENGTFAALDAKKK